VLAEVAPPTSSIRMRASPGVGESRTIVKTGHRSFRFPTDIGQQIPTFSGKLLWSLVTDGKRKTEGGSLRQMYCH
jgi:hypothetical protein